MNSHKNQRIFWAFLLATGICFSISTASVVTRNNLPQIREKDKTDWNGYTKISFTLDSIPAYIVVPKVASPGKPWIWRTSWPDYHFEVDLKLLDYGFHVAYIEVLDLLGSDKALDIMDRFYAEVRARYGLAEKCAIEPNSRGGLHAYRYTARHPERIACLLGDVPVMDFPDASGSAQFVLRHASVPSGKNAGYFDLRTGLANCKTTFEGQRKGRIVFIGGSITHNGGWRDELMAYFRERFPETTFDFVASGVPSVGSVGHAFRLEDDVFSKGAPDLVFVEAAVNDHNYDTFPNGPDLARRGMEGVVRQIRAKYPMADVVEMHFIHDINLPVWNAGKVPYPVEEHEKVAEYYGCPSLNLSREVAERIASGQFTWKDDFKNLHPSPFGQRVYANSMIRMLEAAFRTETPPKSHKMPKRPLDKQSFFNGRHGKLEQAVLSGGFALTQKWEPEIKQEVRAGYGYCPAISTTTAGAEMTYPFKGTAFGLFLAAGRDTGVMEYSTDGAPFREFDTWTNWSNQLYLPWPVILESGLKPGKHTITIRTTDKVKERQGLHIIHILLN